MKIYRCTHVENQIEKTSYATGPIGEYAEKIDQPCGIEAASLEDLLFRLGDRFGLNIDQIIVGEKPARCVEFICLKNEKFLHPSDWEWGEYLAGRLDLWQSYWQFTIRVIDQRYLADADFDELRADDPVILVTT
ncbi:MAG: hypothetical protein WCH39_05860 [Schlesneria sp.]